MANDYRDDDRDFRRRNENRGMFGYEGEGYIRGDYDRDRGGPYDRPRGYSNLESDRGGFRSNAYGDFNRGDYATGRGYGQSEESDRGIQRQSFRGRGPKNYQRSDERIHEDVCERLSLDDDVDASEIEVNVNDATVTLSGHVHDRYMKRRAEDIAESVRGVREVANQIRVVRESKS